VALSYITPNQVHIVLCLEVVFAYILQVTVFGDPIIWTSIVGTIIILTAVLAMMLEDEVQKILRSVKKSPPKALKTLRVSLSPNVMFAALITHSISAYEYSALQVPSWRNVALANHQ